MLLTPLASRVVLLDVPLAVPAELPSERSTHLAPLPTGWPTRVLEHLREARLPIDAGELHSVLEAVEKNAHRFDVNPLAILAVIHVESTFNPFAVSPRGAMGLMQLRAATARDVALELGISFESDELLFEPELNILIGTCYLKRLLDRFGDLDTALAAFHAGPTRIASRQLRTGTVPLAYPDRIWSAIRELRSQALV